jgi:hypothetical protein
LLDGIDDVSARRMRHFVSLFVIATSSWHWSQRMIMLFSPVDLTNTHWCFRQVMRSDKEAIASVEHADPLHCSIVCQ